MTQQQLKDMAGGSRSEYGIFKSMELARSYADRMGCHIVQCDDCFVVAVPRYTERLIKLGYEYA